jgi:hypothetical protein
MAVDGDGELLPALPGRPAMSSKPLVMFDVDGVVNLGLFLSSAQRGRLRSDQGWYSGRAGARHDPYATRIVLNREWGPLIRSIAEAGAEIAWATRWEEAANTWIAPLLGLPSLRYVSGAAGALRKAYRVVPWAEGRPWAWLDDEPEELQIATGMMSRAGGTPFLPVLTERTTGLTEEHADSVKKWLHSL